MEHTCPKCSMKMARSIEIRAAVWRCSGCRGTWFDAEAMRRRIEDAESLLSILSTTGTLAGLSCPSCGDRPLSQAKYRRCEIDWCPACRGVFFDSGEVAAIQAELREGKTSGLGNMTEEIVGGVAGGAVIEAVLKFFRGVVST